MRLPRPSALATVLERQQTTTPATTTFEIPTQRSAPVLEPPLDLDRLFDSGADAGAVRADAPSSGLGGRRRRRVALITALALIFTIGGGGITFAYVQQAQVARSARAVHAAELAGQARAFVGEQLMRRDQSTAAFWAQTFAARAVAVAAASGSVAAARATLAGTPQAGADSRAVLQAAIDAAWAVVAMVPSASVLTLQASVASLVGPEQVVVAAQAAWQAAEDARVAAQQAAAQQAAQAAQAAAQAAQAKPKASAPRTTSTAKTPSAPPAPAAPAGPVAGVEFSAGALGGAINAFRATQGLGALSISRSSGLVAHAGAMAAAGTISHGGSDKIVGYVQPASAAGLVQAWANSPPHRAWMLNTTVSAMQVGAVVLNDRLYGAVNFS